jgi:hypothetical protein
MKKRLINVCALSLLLNDDDTLAQRNNSVDDDHHAITTPLSPAYDRKIDELERGEMRSLQLFEAIGHIAAVRYTFDSIK